MGRPRKNVEPTPEELVMRVQLARFAGREGGIANVLKHGRKKVAQPMFDGLARSLRRQAIELGAVTEADILEKMAYLRKLQATRAVKARWLKAHAPLGSRW